MDTRLQKLFQALRWCGAAMIVAAAGTFLVQRWEQVGDVTRYLALLGITALLPVLAYLCGIRMQETRSARVLMLVLLALIPIHAGVLGGFVLSQFGTATASLGPVAQWVAPSRLGAVLLLAGASSVLIPLLWAAYRVLSRPHAGLLTASAEGAHGLMLIPDRSALTGTCVAGAVIGAAFWCAYRVRPRTREQWLAVGSLGIPAAVVVARQVLFYDVSSVFWGTLLGAVALGLFGVGKRSGDETVERFAVVPTLLSTAAFVDASIPWLTAPFSVVWLTYGLLSAVPLLALASMSARSKGFYVQTAIVMNAVITSVVLLVDPRPWAALQAIAIGLGVLSFGYMSRRRAWLYAGAAMSGVGFIVEVAHAIDAFEPSGWLALAGLGSALVGVTAWLERRARTVREAARPANVSGALEAELSQ